MPHDSRAIRSEIFVAAATVGAHANAGAAFRVRDVKFLIDLFSNWVESGAPGYLSQMQSVQISRYLEGLAAEGFARRLSKKKHPSYRLTRVGLIELIARLVRRESCPSREHFFFLLYLIRNYRPRLEELVRAEGSQFPYALKLELEGLLDVKRLITGEIENARLQRKKLQARMQDALSTSELTKASLAQGRTLDWIVGEAERLYPYELNSQKPLTELLGMLPAATRRWELENGNRLRVEDIWKPAASMLDAYINELETLLRRA